MSIEAIERAAAIAWTVTDQTTMGEWVVSAGNGFSRRRNSAVPVGPLSDDLEQRLAEVAAWYRARGLDTLYRITPLCDPGIDHVLANEGFVLESPTFVMSRVLRPEQVPANSTESPMATEAWITAQLNALDIDRSLADPWLAVIRAVPAPAAFVTVKSDAETVGVGFGVVVGNLLGVFEVAVHPEYRRQGHARSVMAALHSFGAREGAERVFLQVTGDNEAALDLYRSIGYEKSYRYWYRRVEW